MSVNCLFQTHIFYKHCASELCEYLYKILLICQLPHCLFILHL